MIKMVPMPNQCSEEEEPWWDLPTVLKNNEERLRAGLREKVAVHYNDVVEEIKKLKSTGVAEDRQRFLTAVRDALTIYLSPDEHVTVDNPLYYISLYFLQDGENISYIQLGADGTIKYTSNDSLLANAIMYNMDNFREIFRVPRALFPSVEMMLGSILIG